MKKNKKYIIFLLIAIAFVTVIIIFTRGKYVLEKSTDHIQNSEQFYFESDLLEVEEKSVQYTFSEEQKSAYDINFNIMNFQDAKRFNNFDTPYKIDVKIINPDSTITVPYEIKINEKTYDIGDENNVDNQPSLAGNTKVTDNVNVKLDLSNVEKDIELQITAESSSPYVKKLTKIFKIKKEIPYETKLTDKGDYTRLSIKTNSYKGKLNISFNTTKLILEELYYDNNTITINNNIGSKVLDVDENNNYEIDFIKKSNSDVITLNTDIKVEKTNENGN